MNHLIGSTNPVIDPVVRRFIRLLSYRDLIHLQETEREIHNLFQQEGYRQLLRQKAIDTVNSPDTSYEDKLHAIFRMDPILMELTPEYQQLCRRDRLPHVSMEPTPITRTLRGVHWMAPPNSGLQVHLFNDTTGIEYPCLMNARTKKSLFGPNANLLSSIGSSAISSR